MFPFPFPRLGAIALLALVFGLTSLPAAQAQSFFCGAERPSAASDSADSPSAVSDLSLQHYATRPDAGGLYCFYGYVAEKCGDHATANQIYDRCIAAGHPGAMIWKALLLEDGSGVPRDSVAATALLRRAAQSGSGAYATLGKLHYASALFRGHGVDQDVPQALDWFRQAAAEGSPEARAFLETGYHVGERDGATHGVGQRPPGSDAPLLAQASPRPDPSRISNPISAPIPTRAVRLAAATASPSPAPAPAPINTPEPANGLHLALQEAVPEMAAMGPGAGLVLALLLLSVGIGWWRQGRPASAPCITPPSTAPLSL